MGPEMALARRIEFGRIGRVKTLLLRCLCVLTSIECVLGQDSPKSPALPAIPLPIGVPAPAATNDAPYAPQPIVQGGIVMTLYVPDSPHLKKERIREAEVYNRSSGDLGGRRWAQDVECGIGERGFCAVLLQLWSEHDHTSQSAAQ